jgi:glycosyltransferase involved in cell wall biosynthesis
VDFTLELPVRLDTLPTTEKQKKVIFLIPSLTSGGSERVFSILANHLNPEKFDLTVAVLDMNNRLYEVDESRVRLVNLNAARVRQAFSKIIQLINTEKPDLVVSTLSHLNQFIAVVKPFLPRQTTLIARESTILSVFHRQESMPFFRNWLVRRLYPSFDGLICQSQRMTNDFKTTYKLDIAKLTTINNPVDTEGVLHLASAMAVPAKKAAFRFVSVGRLSAEKGLDKALRILATLDNRDFEYHIIGEGSERKRLEKLAETLGIASNVTFQGVQKNPFAWIKSADLLLLTSEFEGFPNVLLESGALGTPVVAFACGGVVAEIITENVSGFVVPDGDEAAFKTAILRGCAMAFDRSLIRYLTKEKFGVARIVKQYEAAFLKIMA